MDRPLEPGDEARRAI